jgi:hypothetical protein
MKKLRMGKRRKRDVDFREAGKRGAASEGSRPKARVDRARANSAADSVFGKRGAASQDLLARGRRMRRHAQPPR